MSLQTHPVHIYNVQIAFIAKYEHKSGVAFKR